MKNILFIHHGSLNGGAPLSMNYTMNALKPFGYKFTVGLVHFKKETIDFFNKNGNEVIDMSWVKTQTIYSAFDKPIYNRHSLKAFLQAKISRSDNSKKISELFLSMKFDLIHLNSVVLNPLADILLEQKIPFVWHIREAAPQKYRGYRFKKIIELMRQSSQLIFLSEAEKESWVGSNGNGIVVNNFVDFNTFNADKSDLVAIREKYSLNENDFTVLFLGGFKEHKGPDLLIEALSILINKKGLHNIRCIMPDTIIAVNKNKVSLVKKAYRVFKKMTQKKGQEYNYNTRMHNLIKERGVEDNCILLPFDPYTQDLFAVSNVVIFPAKVPHFARPIIEAGAMELPVIATDLPILNKLVVNNETGILVGLDALKIADSIEKLYNNKELCIQMGKKGKAVAGEKYNASIQIQLINKLYDNALKK